MILRRAIDAVHAGRLVEAALRETTTKAALRQATAIDVIAAGKAAGVMLQSFARDTSLPVRAMLGIGPARPSSLPDGAVWQDAGHPLPNEGSLLGATRALDLAMAAGREDLLVVLLSGGGSALMALPAPGISLAEKQATARALMEQGADIHELNTVRKHLSSIKGGQLAAAAGGRVLTLAVSDVVGDNLSVIASGPTVADDSTFLAALEILRARGGEARYPAAVLERLRRGAAGEVSETPMTGDRRLHRAEAQVIGPQRGAIEGARSAAEALGFQVHIVAEPVTGEARDAAPALVSRLVGERGQLPSAPLCVIASGETTVTVVGQGRGGRNQEFAFALGRELSRLGGNAAGASIGTDGIDGPTDAAGAMVDTTTFERARAAGIANPDAYLETNNTYEFFTQLNDLIMTGPTSTNVGDLQVILLG